MSTKLFLLTLFLFISCNNKKEIYYFVNHDVKEPFAIVFNRKDGDDKKKFDSNKLFIIPKSRVLLTKDKPILDEWIKVNMFYIDEYGDTIKRIRDLEYDKYHNIPIVDSIYYYNSYTKTYKKQGKEDKLMFKIVIIGKKSLKIGIKDLQRKGLKLEKQIVEKFGYNTW